MGVVKNICKILQYTFVIDVFINFIFLIILLIAFAINFLFGSEFTGQYEFLILLMNIVGFILALIFINKKVGVLFIIISFVAHLVLYDGFFILSFAYLISFASYFYLLVTKNN